MSTTPPSLPTPPATDALPLPWVNQPEFVLTDGQTIGLVYLSALVHWLMKSKNHHFVPAVLALHKALAGLEDVVLYVTKKGGRADVVEPSATFGIDAPQAGRLRGTLMTGVYREATQRRPMPDGVMPGLSAALYLIRHGWGSGEHDESILERADAYGPCLAMLCSQAAVILGVQDVADEVPEPLGSVAEEWTGERLAAQQALFKAGGHKDFAKRTWELAGVKERDGRRLVSEYEATKKTNASASKAVVSTVFDMGKAVAKKTKKRA